jgi:CO/xanthine dehydrogenase FAD-binding subunit
MVIGRYVRPEGLEEAYDLVVRQKGIPVAGGAWLHLGTKRVELAVDLSDCKLRFVSDCGDAVEIGAMTTARDLETSELLTENFGPVFHHGVEHIVGVQLRNIITVGGTVAGKYGFSDLITLLLALDAQVVLYGREALDLVTFLTAPRDTPFLLEKIIIRKKAKAAFTSLRIANNDFAVLNACASFCGGEWRVAVGARPQVARLCPGAAAILGKVSQPDEAAARLAGDAAASELSFGDDTRGSSEYRRSLCSVLVRRAVLEACR